MAIAEPGGQDVEGAIAELLRAVQVDGHARFVTDPPRSSTRVEVSREQFAWLKDLSMPAFYNNPTGVDDIVDHIVGRVLDQLGLPAPRVRRWSGPPEPTPPSSP